MGEAVLGLGLCLISGTMYAALKYMRLPWYVDRTAALVLFVAILVMVVVSGHAMTRPFVRQRNY